jgi:hypothetical protein
MYLRRFTKKINNEVLAGLTMKNIVSTISINLYLYKKKLCSKIKYYLINIMIELNSMTFKFDTKEYF